MQYESRDVVRDLAECFVAGGLPPGGAMMMVMMTKTMVRFEGPHP